MHIRSAIRKTYNTPNTEYSLFFIKIFVFFAGVMAYNNNGLIFFIVRYS